MRYEFKIIQLADRSDVGVISELTSASEGKRLLFINVLDGKRILLTFQKDHDLRYEGIGQDISAIVDEVSMKGDG